MSSLTRRIMKTTTTTTSAASSRIIGGDEEDGVVQVDDGGGGMVYGMGGRAGAPPNIRSRRFESMASTGDDGDTEDLMEPDLSDTSHMKFVDGRCSCCPYGYHVDLDFLQYLESMNSGEYLNSLKKIHPNKEQLKRSLESYLEQQELARRGNATGAGMPQNSPHHGQLAPYDHSIVSGGSRKILSDEMNLGSDVTYDKKYTETIELRKVRHHRNQELDSGSSVSISSGPSSPTAAYSSPSGLESQLRPSPGGKNLTESFMTTSSMTILPKQKRLLELEQQLLEIKPIPPTDQFQHTYLNSAGEFASSATRPPYDEQDRANRLTYDVHDRATRLPYDEHDRATPTNENINGIPRQNQQEPRPDQYAMRPNQADQYAMRPNQHDTRLGQGGMRQDRSEVTLYESEVTNHRGVTGQDRDRHEVRLDQGEVRYDRDQREVRLDQGEVRYDRGVTGQNRDLTEKDRDRRGVRLDQGEVRYDQGELTGQDRDRRGVRLDQGEVRYDQGESSHDQGDSPEMTHISAATLQAIREQMAASLQRMHDLEEQVKEIPILQVRNSTLKEEKRLLELQLQSKADQLQLQSKADQLQLQSKADRMRSVGVGDFTVDESDFDERSEYSYKRYLQTLGEDERRRLAGSRADTEGTDGDGIYRSTTTMSVGYGMDGELIPVRVHEKELKTEENTEIKEKEVKTIFLGGGDDVLTADFTGDRTGRALRSVERFVKKDVRSIGVGEGNVLDSSGGVEVHQKELRTVYIGDAGKQQKTSTRNVGILCKPAMRDVGMVHMIDSERPMVRTIAVGVGEMGVSIGDGGFYSGDEGPEGAAAQMMNAAMSQTTISSYQSRFLGLKNDQLRSLLDEMLKRTVHSVAVQCNFNTEDKAIDASRVGYDMVDVACSDDVIDVDVVPIRQMKSVAIDNRPSLFHRACGTDFVYKIDMATNTQTQGMHHHRATNTETAVTYPAATNTEAPVRANAAVETEKSVFYALQQLMNTGTNTNIQEFWNVGLNTDLSGDVQELIIKPEQKDISVNTVTSSVKVWDKMTSTTPSQRMEKAVNTTGVPQLERGINTEKLRVSVAAVNTDRIAIVSRGIDCNIIQPEKKTSLEEGVHSSRSTDVNKSIRTVTTETSKPVEHRDTRTGVTHQQEVIPRRGDFESTDSKADDNREFEEVTVSGGTGGRTTTTRIVKTTTRGGRYDLSSEFPTSDTGFQSVANMGDGMGSSGGSSSSTRTVTRVTRGGRSEITDDFPESKTSVLGSMKEQFGDAESRSSSRTTATERPQLEDEFGFGSSGSKGTTTRTVTTVTRGGRSGLTEDFPTGEVGFRRFERDIGSSGVEGPDFDESFSSGRSGGRTVTSRTVRSVTRGGGGGGRSEVVEEFPAGDVSFRDDGQEHLGSGNAEGSGSRRIVTSQIIKRTSGGEQLGGSSSQSLVSSSDATARTIGAEGESRLMSLMDEGSTRLHALHGEDITGGSGGGQSRYSSSRTIIKRSSGDPNDPESWTEETWVSDGSGDGSTNSQILSSSQSGAMEIPDQSSATSEMRIERHMSGKMLSSGMTTSEEPLRSIMKTTRQTDRSSDRFTSGRTGITFSDSSTSKYEASQELQSSLNIYDDWLEDSTRVTAQQLNSSLTIVQKEWLKVSSHKTSSSSQVEGFLNTVHSLSPDLMKQVINMADANGNTALHYAVSNCNMDVVSLLLNTNSCDINHQNKTGCTAVMMAALTEVKSERHREVIRQLFEMGDVNIQAPNDANGGSELAGQTALMLAVSHGRLDMAKMLLDFVANVNLQDEDGSTALMVAAEHGHVDIARLLLAQPDCDAFIKDKDGSTAMSVAKEGGRQSIVSLLNAHITTKSSKPESRIASLHKARKVVTRITLSSPTTEMS